MSYTPPTPPLLLQAILSRLVGAHPHMGIPQHVPQPLLAHLSNGLGVNPNPTLDVSGGQKPPPTFLPPPQYIGPHQQPIFQPPVQVEPRQDPIFQPPVQIGPRQQPRIY